MRSSPRKLTTNAVSRKARNLRRARGLRIPQDCFAHAHRHPSTFPMTFAMTNSRCLLLAVLVLAACGSEGGEAPRSSADSAAAPSTSAVPGADSAPAPAAAPAARTVVLAPDGLELAGGGGGAERLAFGASRARVLAAVGAVLGEPRQQGAQEECPAGPLYHAQYAAGLQVVFQDSAFVGWSADEGSAFRTAAGVGPGSPVAQLRAAHPAATIEETSLGMEFASSGLYGIVTDSTAAGQVQMMFAGTNCIFR
jgi:hypothetical protein